MFVGGFFIRSATPLSNLFTLPSIFSRSPPPSFVRSSLATITDYFRDALAICQLFWPLFLIMFCISLFACFVQQYIFSMLAFVSRNLANGMRRVYLPLFNLARPTIDRVIKLLPKNLNLLKKSKKKTSGRPRSVSDKSGPR
ncbi:hypothetical protein CI102_2702 [Trichoderma harzianum]|uniref:Uncharacterized protein n=1 Tax=Trichoderma harzianum CBS 226.95 TaxID=983964 RepID=A0A2T4AL19_TRIHA|nr:hypothetical protein M431DRAFT_77316 [Trichoderma harzianum CBS 226.95]PKK52784.1 hypothetical protein CI102_2702 [Trichoderma harzianum]PTB57781.1 hypothetical protein M431DRAFT_77316 [Trichoderma harzianum CBS 226.95]